MHPRIKSERVQLPLMPHLFENVKQGDLSDELLLATPEIFRDGNARLIQGLKRGGHLPECLARVQAEVQLERAVENPSNSDLARFRGSIQALLSRREASNTEIVYALRHT
jgi:hypothetical protein